MVEDCISYVNDTLSKITSEDFRTTVFALVSLAVHSEGSKPGATPTRVSETCLSFPDMSYGGKSEADLPSAAAGPRQILARWTPASSDRC